MSSEYQYSPISTRGGIRVLDLSPGDFEDPISCRIRHISIEESEHEFKAISYAWGNDPTRSQYIYVNNNKDHLKVTLSCYNMLRWLRNEEMTRTMWIDTICINQDDDAEKSLQVREMGKIYAAAEPTLIYLGEHTPGSDTLFRHLHEAHRKLNSKESTDTPLSKPRKKIVDEVEHLFERAWFSRIWVIQELRNSPLPYFVCGRDVVYAPTLVDCHYGYSRNLPIPIFSPAPIKIYTIPFKRLLGECKTPAQKMYLLATETGLCKSTNPKDRIFALAPLIKNQPAELINLIDYSLDVDEVFRRFALFLLPDTGLALLRMVQHPRSEGLLPSWVPDWARTRERSPYDNLVTQFFEYYGSRQSYRHFYTKSVNKPMDQLIVRGIRYGYIEELGPLLHTGEGNSMSKIKAASDLIHTLGMLRKGIKVPDWPDSIMQAVRHIKRGDIFDLLRGSDSPAKRLNDEISSNIISGCTKNRVFVTSNGSLGVGPDEAQPGDLVCVVRGAIDPCIFRKRGPDQWVVISGNCVMLDVVKDYRSMRQKKGVGRKEMDLIMALEKDNPTLEKTELAEKILDMLRGRIHEDGSEYVHPFSFITEVMFNKDEYNYEEEEFTLC